ncbi:unnamed protein product [Prorocentrum cordatum]|uniref:Uncharacterized protein n=1 Tax=Prorocentrum cordatum TaxID=2364126 RepID=A0ABN9WNJ2_9DINO|nr:unnamed protein product [Polarella glacialis]
MLQSDLESDEVSKPVPRRTKQSIFELTRKTVAAELQEDQARQLQMLQGDLKSEEFEAASASLAPQLQALQEDIANLKEVQRQNAEMMDFLAKHEARLAEKLRARAHRPSPTLC